MRQGMGIVILQSKLQQTASFVDITGLESQPAQLEMGIGVGGIKAASLIEGSNRFTGLAGLQFHQTQPVARPGGQAVLAPGPQQMLLGSSKHMPGSTGYGSGRAGIRTGRG
jgi:hypothetical protein